ncbi:hypothetical protein [uncultured Dysosmobacter sp.]|uniref:hypothetical protein n=1 Tax=uncultured Dysosmobacter sp. TaxID=2591384 RepID=UPI00261953FD|nr:hypothetical protein [uncultured Dysosmobacter sp.]
MRGNPIQQQKYNEKVTKAADSFWGAFQMTENGKVKSTLMLYSFCLAWLFIFVYGALFFFLLDPLDAVLAGLPVTAVNLLEALIPSAVGAAVCGLAWFLSKTEKRLLPAAYLWAFLLMLACLITLLIYSKDEPEVRQMILWLFGMFVLPPLVLGGGSSIFLYYRYWKNKPQAAPAARLEKRQ